jgi:phytoene dehydrogenase-like protein
MKKFLCDNVMRVEMNFDRMFLFRPPLEMSACKTLMKSFLTDASTHPGGVFAASGHNMAQIVLKDVKGKWF